MNNVRHVICIVFMFMLIISTDNVFEEKSSLALWSLWLYLVVKWGEIYMYLSCKNCNPEGVLDPAISLNNQPDALLYIWMAQPYINLCFNSRRIGYSTMQIRFWTHCNRCWNIFLAVCNLFTWFRQLKIIFQQSLQTITHLLINWCVCDSKFLWSY